MAVASLAYAIPSLPVDGAAIGLFGIAVPLYAVAVTTATQRHAPPRLQGRANAASDMAVSGRWRRFSPRWRAHLGISRAELKEELFG